jgi:hypothetical protein
MFHLQILPHDFDYLGALQDRQRVEHGSCHLATSMTLCPYRRPQERAHASLEEHLATSFTEAEDLTLTTGDIGTARAPFMSTSVAVRRNIPDAGGFDFGQSHRKGRSPRRIASTAGLERAATSAAELREDRREIEAAQGKPLPTRLLKGRRSYCRNAELSQRQSNRSKGYAGQACHIDLAAASNFRAHQAR